MRGVLSVFGKRLVKRLEVPYSGTFDMLMIL